MIRCLIFDFDGTLVPSNDIKRNAFATAVAHIDGGPAAIQAILAESPTADRYTVFDALTRQLGAERAPIDLVDRYGEICESLIVPLIANGGVSALLERLSAAGLDLHLATATPLPAIVAVLEASGVAGIFRSVHGRPQSKADAIREILDEGMYDPATVAVIGDGTDDREAAMATGCHFVSVQPDASELYGQSTAKAVAFLAERLTLPAMTVNDRV